MAHGSCGNRFANGLFDTIAHALQKERYTVLAFDFSGHGESDDAILSLAQSIDDVASAIKFAKEYGYKKISLMGHSLGAYPCLANFSQSISTMILIGALTGPVVWDWETMCSQEQLEGLRKTGYIVAEINDGLRSVVTVDGNLLQDIQAIDQEPLLQAVKCPVIIIHGDADQQERDLLAFSQKGITHLSKESALNIIHGASHNFLESFDTVVPMIQQWLKKYFSC